MDTVWHLADMMARNEEGAYDEDTRYAMGRQKYRELGLDLFDERMGCILCRRSLGR